MGIYAVLSIGQVYYSSFSKGTPFRLLQGVSVRQGGAATLKRSKMMHAVPEHWLLRYGYATQQVLLHTMIYRQDQQFLKALCKWRLRSGILQRDLLLLFFFWKKREKLLGVGWNDECFYVSIALLFLLLDSYRIDEVNDRRFY